MLRTVEDVVARAFLDDIAVLHHDHPVGDLLDHGKVVADEQAGKAVLLLQVGEQGQHLRP